MKQTVHFINGFKAVLRVLFFVSAPIFTALKAATPCRIDAVSVSCAVPFISSFSPSSATAGSAGFVLTLNGVGFTDPSIASGSVTDVSFNGSFRASTFISLTQMRITLTAADLLVPGSYAVFAQNSLGSAGPTNFVVNPCASYIAAASTAWTTPATWACGSVPIATSNVTIPTGKSVSLSTTTTVNDLTLAGTGKLNLNAPITVNGILTGSSSGYIITGSSSITVTLTVAAGIATTFPIGSLSTTYDPFTITSNLTQKVSASVVRVLSLPPLAGYFAQEQVISDIWNITVASPATTIATLSFRPDPATVTQDAAGWLSSGYLTVPSTTVGTIGHFISSSSRVYYYDQYKASISSGTWTVSNYDGGFSPFQVGFAGAFNPVTLAVGLKSFSAKSKNGVNLVEWTTEQERDNASFTVERAPDGQQFQAIGTVKGNGSTTQNHDYFFEDKDPSVFSTYYRLKTTESGGGATTFSKIVAVLASKDGRLKVFPTLTHDKLTIETDTKAAERFDIVNLLNQTVVTGVCQGQKEVDVRDLTNGLYVLKMAGQSLKFVKN